MDGANPKIFLISLGCAKNLVDSEVMLGSLRRDGMELTDQPTEADVVIINTCGFIESAKQESIDTILEANRLRQTGRCRALIMAGCLTQRYPKELRRELPEVDAVIGLNEVPRIPQIVRDILGEDPVTAAPRLYWSGPARYVPDFSAPRLRLTPSHTAYVKIAEGRNHPCTFCSIPRIRGRHRSRPAADVVAEIRTLVEQGTRELNLISQDTTFYGKDLPEWTNATGKLGSQKATAQPAPKLPLGNLLREIQQIPGEFWVRLLYTHPFHWTDELVDTIAACDKVCRYVDMPLQHINDDLLRAMKRETDGRYIRDLVRRIRSGVPGIALRTTFIVGFPGETEAQFEELLGFLEETRFDRVGIFKYSQEDHTPAGNMDRQVPDKIKQDRYDRAMTLQQTVSRQGQQTWLGKTVRVLVDGPAENGDGWIGRSHADAPDIDGRVYVHGNDVVVGEFVDVTVTDTSEYDLVGTARNGNDHHLRRTGDEPGAALEHQTDKCPKE